MEMSIDFETCRLFLGLLEESSSLKHLDNLSIFKQVIDFRDIIHYFKILFRPTGHRVAILAIYFACLRGVHVEKVSIKVSS